jgi:hypothetical protein
MAFLLDFNPLVIAKTATATKELGVTKVDLLAIKNYFFRDILHIRQKFRDAGEFIICRDAKSNWRKDFFPYYKINRKDARAEMPFDWELCKEAIEVIGQDLVDWFPYKVVQTEKAEADDVIAVLTKHIRGWKPGMGICVKDEEVTIGSRDGDFLSLQIIPGVQQYSLIDKKYLRETDPEGFLRRKILKGDTGDGVPNVLSEDDSIAMKIRQKPITEARITTWESHWKETGQLHPDLDFAKYDRNKRLVDLVDGIPQEISDQILQDYKACTPTNRLKTASYFIHNRMQELHRDLQHF